MDHQKSREEKRGEEQWIEMDGGEGMGVRVSD
jgi:hypothetical protein